MARPSLQRLLALSASAAALAAITVGGGTAFGAGTDAATSGAPGVSNHEFPPGDPDADQVNRDVPNGQSAAHVPSSHVPRPGTLSVGGSDATTRIDGLNLADQRTADGGNQFSLEPPDQGLCVGGGRVVEAVNDVFSVYSTSGNQIAAAKSLTTFFTGQHQVIRNADGTATYGPFLSDPKCYYDPADHRFFMTVLDIDNSPTTGDYLDHSAELIAVSKTSTPSTSNTGWRFYQIDTSDNGGKDTSGGYVPSAKPGPTTGEVPPVTSPATTDGTGGRLPDNSGCPCFGDQPLIGADANGFYVTSNEFSIDGPEFNGAQIYALSKSGLESGTMSFQAIRGNPIPLAEGPAYSVQPATSPTSGQWETAHNGTEYFLSALDFDATLDHRIAVWSLTNTDSLATSKPSVRLSHALLDSEVYGQPPDAQQKSGPTPLADAVKDHEELIAANDDRMNQVVYANGRLFGGVNTVVKTDTGPTHVGIAYFVVQPSGTSKQVAGSMAHQGYVAVGQNNVLYPSIGVTAGGKGVMTFSLTGQDYYPSAAYIRLKQSGATSGPVRIDGAGTKPDDGFTGYQAYGGTGTGRWGDYSAAVATPGGSVWIASEYIPGTFGYPPYLANWGTEVASVTP